MLPGPEKESVEGLFGTNVTLNELGIAVPILGVVGGWIWNASRIATQMKGLMGQLTDLHADLRKHVADENETFDKIHDKLSDHHASLARIEGRLHKNGLDK